MSEQTTAVAPLSTAVHDLFEEICQIHEQYKREVPRKRRPWPTSIQSRILELWKLGVTTNQISEATGLSTQTMYSWRQRLEKANPGFLPVPIVKKRRTKAELPERHHHRRQRSLSESTTTTVTVIMPSGVRLEGVPVDAVARILREVDGR